MPHSALMLATLCSASNPVNLGPRSPTSSHGTSGNSTATVTNPTAMRRMSAKSSAGQARGWASR